MKDSGVRWLGMIPKSWDLDKIVSLYSERSTKVSDKDYPALSVTKQGIVPQLESAAKTDNGDNRKLIKKNDFVINSRSDRRGSCGISEYEGSCSLINIVLAPKNNMVNRYYNYLFKTELFADEFYKWGNGIVDDLWSTKWSNMKNIMVPFPSLEEQQAIAERLDTKCAQIDTIIANEQSVIEKLQEYKKAIITETIIKGLNDSVERQNQGAVWFHGVPISWTFSELRYVTRDIFDIDHWMPESQDEGIPYLMTGDLESRTSYIDFSKTKKISIEDFNRLAKNKYPCCHDIIMARYASIGNCTYVDTSNQFLVSYSCLTIRPNIDKILPMFMYYYFKSYAFSEECKVYIKSNTQGNIGKDNLRRIKLAYPSIREQALIVKYLDTKCANIDSVMLKKQSLINKLTEYKKSLIYEVVTGKKEVPHV